MIGIPRPEEEPQLTRSGKQAAVKDVSVAEDVPDVSMAESVRPTSLAAIPWPSYAMVRDLRRAQK